LVLTLLETLLDFGGACLDNPMGRNQQTPYQPLFFFDLSSSSKQTLQRSRQQLQHME
jgi:hypothetical protein